MNSLSRNSSKTIGSCCVCCQSIPSSIQVIGCHSQVLPIGQLHSRFSDSLEKSVLCVEGQLLEGKQLSKHFHRVFLYRRFFLYASYVSYEKKGICILWLVIFLVLVPTTISPSATVLNNSTTRSRDTSHRCRTSMDDAICWTMKLEINGRMIAAVGLASREVRYVSKSRTGIDRACARGKSGDRKLTMASFTFSDRYEI